MLVALVGCTPGTTPTSSRAPFSEALREELLVALAEAPPSQRAILADGEVTFDEYESAVLATLACLRDAGIEVGELRRSPDGTYLEYTYGGVPDEGVASLEELFNDCRDANSIYVEDYYALEHAPTASEVAERVEQASRCMREGGMTVPQGASFQDLQDLVPTDPDTALECLRAAGL